MSIWSQIEKAVEVCTAGGIIAYPTEYCFGLGCDPLNETAVRRILTLKHRSWAKGLIVITDDVRRLRRLIDFSVGSSLITPLANWPGPHTWLLPALTATPRWLRGQHDTLAVRLITTHWHWHCVDKVGLRLYPPVQTERTSHRCVPPDKSGLNLVIA